VATTGTWLIRLAVRRLISIDSTPFESDSLLVTVSVESTSSRQVPQIGWYACTTNGFTRNEFVLLA
jgi:hypothetical protein